jgi:tRNA(Arg) A34 adenosine deaminase TadA
MNLKIKNKLKELAKDVEPVSRVRLVAAVLYKNKIISIGKNQYKTHPAMIKFGKNSEAVYLHAEVDAINKASRVLNEKQFKKASLYVVRVKKDGSLGLAKPCTGCQKCIDHYNINSVEYTKNEL